MLRARGLHHNPQRFFTYLRRRLPLTRTGGGPHRIRLYSLSHTLAAWFGAPHTFIRTARRHASHGAVITLNAQHLAYYLPCSLPMTCSSNADFHNKDRCRTRIRCVCVLDAAFSTFTGYMLPPQTTITRYPHLLLIPATPLSVHSAVIVRRTRLRQVLSLLDSALFWLPHLFASLRWRTVAV